MPDGLLTIATPAQVRAVAASRGSDGLLRAVRGQCPDCCGTVPCPPATGYLKFKKCACNRSGSPTPVWVITGALFRQLTGPYLRKCITILGGPSLGGGTPGICQTVQVDSERLDTPPAGAFVLSDASQIPAGGFLGTCCDCCRAPALRTCGSGALYYKSCCANPDSGVVCWGESGPGSAPGQDICCGQTAIVTKMTRRLESWEVGGPCTAHYILDQSFTVSGTAAASGTLRGSASQFEQLFDGPGFPPPPCGVDRGVKFSYADAEAGTNCTGVVDSVRSTSGAGPTLTISKPGCTPKFQETTDGLGGVTVIRVTGSESPTRTSVRLTVTYDRPGRPALGIREAHSRDETTFDIWRSGRDAVCSRRCAFCNEPGPSGGDPGDGEPTGSGALMTPGRRGIVVAGLREMRAVVAEVGESRMASGESGGGGESLLGGCAGCGSATTDAERAAIAAVLRSN